MDYSICVIRIISSLFIFLCHAGSRMGGTIGTAMGEFFSVGVQIFFMLSGYLYSRKPKERPVYRFYLRRYFFLAKPIWIYLSVLFIIHVLQGISIDVKAWIASYSLLNGIVNMAAPGSAHLWFVSCLLVCYMVTPFLPRLSEIKNLKQTMIVCGGGATVLLCMTAYWLPGSVSTVLKALYAYGLGFYFLPSLLGKRAHYVVWSGLLLLTLAIRLLGKHFLDDTPLYDVVIAGMTHISLGLWILLILYYLSDTMLSKYISKKIITAVKTLNAFTYEFYIVHYCLLTGPIRIEYFNNVFLNIGAAFAGAYVLAVILKLIDMNIGIKKRSN